MHIYNDVDVVEGLDVDRETSFSKYGTRLGVSRIFNELWDDPLFFSDFLKNQTENSATFHKMCRILLPNVTYAKGINMKLSVQQGCYNPFRFRRLYGKK